MTLALEIVGSTQADCDMREREYFSLSTIYATCPEPYMCQAISYMHDLYMSLQIITRIS
jgi:hypothetical protein